MNDRTAMPAWGSFALVSYIPDPLRSCVGILRQHLPREDDAPPHITILPPRPLQLPVDDASELALKILLEFSAFNVKLAGIRVFPNTRVLYLDLAQGKRVLYDLHSALNRDELNHAEQFEFRPHLTLGGPVPPHALESTVHRIESAWRSVKPSPAFSLDEVAFLWLPPDSPQGEWRRLWTYKLSTKGTTRACAATAAVTQTY